MDVICTDIPMCNKAESTRPHAARPDAILLEACHCFRTRETGIADIEVHNIGFRPRVEANARDVLKYTGKRLRIGVVNLDIRKVVLERVKSPGSKDSSLPHRTTENVLPATRFMDECSRAKEKRSCRGSQSFGKTKCYRLERGRDF
jgi:hypothetical protein